MEPVRVLHENVVMDPGGIETQLMRIYRNIDRHKVQFDFLVHRAYKGAYDDEILNMGGRIYYTAPFNPFFYNKYINTMKNVFKKHPEYKVFVVHSELALGPLKVAKEMGIPVRICFSHNNQTRINLKRFFLEYEKLYLKQYCTNMFAVSEIAARYSFGNDVVENNKVNLIKNGIEVSDYIFDEVKRNIKRKELGLEEKFVVGHIGRFMEQKNHIFLLEVFNEFKKVRKDAHLILIGEGRLESKIRNKISELGINDSVSILGRRMDVADLMKAMDVFLFPSFYEGLPNVVIEAQASALPVLMSDSISREVIFSDYVFNYSLTQKAKKWAYKLNEVLLNNIIRKDMSKVVAINGYNVREKAKWYEKIYLNLHNNEVCDMK